MQDDELQMLEAFMTKNEWPPNLTKQDRTYFKTLAEKAFQDKNKVVWVRLEDFKYPRTALYLPSRYRKGAMCEAHDRTYGGHNATHKTYLKISTSYYWPKMIQDIERNKNFCLRCQQRKKYTNKRTPLAPLPILEHPNLRIHADLFGPMITASVTRNLSFASRMHLLSILWSLQLPARMLKQIGF
jgi:Integrase zinc binding domain